MNRLLSGGSALILLWLCMHTVALPQSSASRAEEERAMEVLDAFAAGDLDALLASMNEHWVPADDPQERADRWQRAVPTMLNEFGDGVVVSVLIQQEHVIEFVTERPGGPTLAYTFEFETDPPHRILRMNVDFHEGRGGPELPRLEIPIGMRAEQIEDVVDPWVRQLADDGAFSGVLMIAVDGKPVYSVAVGKASIEWDVPNRLDTRFDLGSINKSFTQVALAQLAVEGKLSFDDHIIDHLPDYPNADAARQITIRHLIEQTSGLGDIFTDEFFQSSRALYRTPRDFFPLFADKPLARKPGEKREYSNAGYMVLGAIIAEASGMPYEDYVKEHIFKPAGMTGAGFFAHDEPVPNVAVGYTRMGPDGELRNNLFMLPIKGNSAGSAQASAEDLLKFDNALREHVLLPPAWTAWYFGGPEPDTANQRFDDVSRSTAETGIAGGAPGVSAVMEGNGRLTVIVLSNFDPPTAEDMGRELYQKLNRVVRDN
ncbi:MAG: hypothetical protein Kow0074_06200 [Candidatus Zixiibacteriota bacterium]